MNTREYFNWLKEQEDKTIWFTLLHEKIKLTNKIDGFKVTINNAINITITFNNSGSAELPLSPDSIIEKVANGYRVCSDDFIYIIQTI